MSKELCCERRQTVAEAAQAQRDALARQAELDALLEAQADAAAQPAGGGRAAADHTQGVRLGAKVCRHGLRQFSVPRNFRCDMCGARISRGKPCAHIHVHGNRRNLDCVA